MRLVAVADTHTFEDDLVVPDGDVFIHAGDMTRGGMLAEMRAVATWVNGLPHHHKIIVAGNHDWCFAREREAAVALFDAHYLEDDALVLDGVRFWGSPWQPAFHNWAFNLERGAPLAEKWALIPEDTDVLITHGPPEGYGDRVSDSRGTGCVDLLAALRRVQPRLHMFGHIHEDGGLWHDGDVAIANVTTWECERQPTVIDIDPATGAVTPVDIPPKR